MVTRKDRLFAGSVKNMDSGCINWVKAKTLAGYGVIRTNGVLEYAHRLAAEIFLGEDVSGKVVLHKCDNPSCINPDHLVVGSHKDNMKDMTNKKRHCHGQDRVNLSVKNNSPKWTKLNTDDVRNIYTRALSGESRRIIAAEYGVCKSSIDKIMNGDTWSHVTGVVCKRHKWKEGSDGSRYARADKHPMAKLTMDQVDEIKSSNSRTTDLVSQYGVSKSTINRIRSGRLWADHKPENRVKAGGKAF